LLDSIILEQHGIPSVPIVTTVFRGVVTALAKAQGYSNFPLAVVKHPVAYIGDAELDERARDALHQIVTALAASRGD